jgi:dihydroorotate dehydrogenase (NAD+) catalytic subunit
MVNLSVNIGKLKLKNPVMLASGTWNLELKDFLDLNKLGALVTKTITLKPNSGNPYPRTCEVTSGMLNSIGLENPGLDLFLKKDLVLLLKLKVPIIVSIGTVDNPKDLVILAKELDKIKEIKAIELNISCPNIKKTKIVSQDKKETFKIVKSVRQKTKKVLITKLSPNVSDITEIALSVQKAGSDAISLINTVLGMSVDIETKRPKLSTISGGLSGPAIKPIALRMVWEVYNKVKIPIIGMGGIMNLSDALEFFICGANAIAIGTANFINPSISLEIIKGLKDYLLKNKIKDIKDLVGTLKV